MATAHASILLACVTLVASHRAGLQEPPPAVPAVAASGTVPPIEGCRWIPSAPPQSPAPRVRIIDLWGPWSGESTSYMPRLSRLAREHASAGVAVCGITKETPSFDAERIEDALRRLGGRVTYPVGIAPAPLFAQLVAISGLDSPPATIVADASGTVIATCTPAEVEHVIVRILAGTWGGPPDIAAVRRESTELDDLVALSVTDPLIAASQLERLPDTYPHRQRDFASRRITILLRAGRTGDAASAMQSATEEWIRLQDAHELTTLATLWMDPRINAARRDMGLASTAAEAAAQISGDLDPNPWLLLMRTRMASGDAAGARAAGERAMAMGDARMQSRIAQMLSKIPNLPPEGTDATQQRPHAH